jgi:hypothetical protein
VAAGHTGQLRSQDRGRVNSMAKFPPDNSGNRDKGRRGRDEFGHGFSEDAAGPFDAPILQIVDE